MCTQTFFSIEHIYFIHNVLIVLKCSGIHKYDIDKLPLNEIGFI